MMVDTANQNNVMILKTDNMIYAQDSKCSLLPGQFSASKFSPGVFETLEASFGAVLKAIHSDI